LIVHSIVCNSCRSVINELLAVSANFDLIFRNWV